MAARTVPAGNIGGNYYNKYETRNPIARHLVRGFLAAFEELVDMAHPTVAFEVGCGEGELLARLQAKGISVSGCDVDQDIVERARTRLPGVAIDVANLSDMAACYLSADLVVCCEVLEHVENVPESLKALQSMTASKLLVSVPREPVWRMLNMLRGKYWGDLGNTPGHINHWSKAEFLRLISQNWSILAVRAPLPWTMVLCERRPVR